jgi:hypothetical protein
LQAINKNKSISKKQGNLRILKKVEKKKKRYQTEASQKKLK